MSDLVFNIAKGRVTELVNRVNNNDPANSAIVLVALKTSGLAADATLRDYATLAAVTAGGSTEATNSGYARKVLDDTAGIVVTTDNSADQVRITIPDQTWTAVAATGGAWSKLLICYDNDTTGGTDANIIPLTAHDFVVTPDGNDIVADFNATTGFFQAS